MGNFTLVGRVVEVLIPDLVIHEIPDRGRASYGDRGSPEAFVWLCLA